MEVLHHLLNKLQRIYSLAQSDDPNALKTIQMLVQGELRDADWEPQTTVEEYVVELPDQSYAELPAFEDGPIYHRDSEGRLLDVKEPQDTDYALYLAGN